jgi:hypothetical protein
MPERACSTGQSKPESNKATKQPLGTVTNHDRRGTDRHFHRMCDHRLSAQLIPELCFEATRLALRKKRTLTSVKERWP